MSLMENNQFYLVVESDNRDMQLSILKYEDDLKIS